MTYRTRHQIVLAEVQAATGTEESPTVGSNAVKVEVPSWTYNMDSVQTNYVTGSLDRSQSEPGGGSASIRLPCYLKNSGTAGTAPDAGTLMRGCAMSETTTGVAVSGTATAGAASTITLAAGASAVDDAYNGMVITTTGGTGSGQTRVVVDYDGTTKVATVTPAWDTQPDATTDYEIPINVLYRPVSTGAEVLTIWQYMRRADAGNARRKRLFDAAGTMTLRAAAGQLASLEFNYSGRLAATPDDVADPGDPTYGGGTPKALLSATAYLADTVIKFSELRFDLGNQVTMQDDPSDSYGVDLAQVIERTPGGRINPQMTLLSTRDAFTDWRNSTAKHLWLTWGASAGERVSILMPSIQYTGNETDDVRGFAQEGLPFETARSDDAIFICFW